MKKRYALFLLTGLLLFLISLPFSTKLIMEIIHEQRMNWQYEMNNINPGYPPKDFTYEFNGHVIEVQEKIREDESYTDPWQYKMGLADLTLRIDGKEIDTLKEHPIRVEEIGLNRYYGELAFLTLKEKKRNETKFIALLKETKEILTENENGDILGSVEPEKVHYTLYALDENGEMEQQSFTLTERSAVQTELLNEGKLAPYPLGYYTNDLEGYPVIYYPFIFPFGTLVVGFILMIFFWPWRKVKEVKGLG